MLSNSPVSSEKVNQVIEILDVPENGRILDIGCGTGEFLIRAIEATGAHGLGVDIDLEAVSAARESAAGRLSDSLYEFRTADIQVEPSVAGWVSPLGAFDDGVWVLFISETGKHSGLNLAMKREDFGNSTPGFQGDC
jgi:SAM-dependent methyltransferase